MKIVTNDYGCGTSSSILDYNTDSAIVVSEDNWEFLIDTHEDLFFVGHDFLMYMWDTDEKVEKWHNHKGKRIVWCFEPIDSHIEQWHAKSHYSLSQCQKFMHDIFASDERSCDKYKVKWLPQWCSNLFYEMRSTPVQSEKILFSGQAGNPEYKQRNNLISSILQDPELKEQIEITNTTRNLSWIKYIENFLKYPVILNPVGILKGCNTRTYEALISGRVLLQQEDEIGYQRHKKLLQKYPNVFFYKTYKDLKEIILDTNLNDLVQTDTSRQYENNNIFKRFETVGLSVI